MKSGLLLFLLFILVHGQDSVPLTSIKTLTLYKDKLTRGRRSAPVQQLSCVSGDACERFKPQVMQCYNQGVDHSGEVQWKCHAEMEDLYRLGTTTVSCEGYLSSEDTNILSGSCGVEYTLHLTEKGKRHFYPPRPVQQKVVYSPPLKREELTIFGFLTFIFACCCTAAVIIACNSVPDRRHHHHHHYATRSQTTIIDDTPVYHRRTAPVIIDDAPPVVIHHRNRPTVVVEDNSYHYQQPSAPSRSPSPVRHYTSTGYGGTKKTLVFFQKILNLHDMCRLFI